MKPILFSTPMVQAILEGRKTQTRRVITPQNSICETHHKTWLDYDNILINGSNTLLIESFINDSRHYLSSRIQKGDILWVRESFFDTSKHQEFPLFKNKPKYLFKSDNVNIGCHSWKPSIHMPKAATRIFLKVTNVRAERLHDITWNDSIAEGIEVEYDIENAEQPLYKFYPCNDLRDETYSENPVSSFCSLWKSINGLGSWQSNPWVWVYEFERIDKSQINELTN